MELKEVQRRMRLRNLKACAKDTGLAHQTLLHIARGATKNPRPETIETIKKWMEEN